LRFVYFFFFFFFFSSRRRHTRSYGDWSSDVCSSDLGVEVGDVERERGRRDDPERDREHAAGTDPAKAWLLHVWRAPVEEREHEEIGRASCRERVERWGVAGG